MMLTWNVTYHCKQEQRAAFYQALCDLGERDHSLAEACAQKDPSPQAKPDRIG